MTLLREEGVGVPARPPRHEDNRGHSVIVEHRHRQKTESAAKRRGPESRQLFPEADTLLELMTVADIKEKKDTNLTTE